MAPSNFTTLNMSHCNRMEPSGDHYTMPMLPMISFLVTFGLIIGCDDLLNVHPVAFRSLARLVSPLSPTQSRLDLYVNQHLEIQPGKSADLCILQDQLPPQRPPTTAPAVQQGTGD